MEPGNRHERMLKHVRVSCFCLHVVFYIRYDFVTSKRIFEYISWNIIDYIIYVIAKVKLERDVKSERNQEIDTKEY